MIMRQTAKGALAALLATTALGLPSLAEAATPAPKFTASDQNGVDLTTGLVWLSVEEGGIGSGPGRVAMQRIWAEGAGWIDNWSGGVYKVTSGGVTKAYVQFGGISDVFTGSGSTWTSDKADGATLTVNTFSKFVYTSRDGTQIEFDADYSTGGGVTTSVDNCPGADPGTCQVPLSITKPNGLTFRLGWFTKLVCQNGVRPIDPTCETPILRFQRLSSVVSSAGYSLAISYASGDETTSDWFKRTGVTFNNSASPPSPQPAISYTYGTNTIDVTDPASRTWRFTTDASARLTAVRRPGSASNNINYTYGAGGTVTSATKDGVVTSYALSGSTMTVTNALSQQTIVTSDPNIGRPTSYRDPLNRTTTYTYDANGRLKRTTEPEGNYSELTYDGRGNVTQNKLVAKNGTSTLTSSASYDPSCSNIVKCNKPNSTTDARGNSTTYIYDATHGGVLTVTPPSPATGVQPQTRYTYTQVQGAADPQIYGPVYMLTKVDACPSGSTSCTNADKVQTSAGYNSNLLPTAITRGNASGTLAATTAITYDARGNVDAIDGPLSGTADTTKYRYDAADQMVGVISPDPDGAGALKNRAKRITYRPDGQVSKQELGTTAGQTDTAWNNFAPLQTVDVTFDTDSRPTKQTLKGGTTTYAITQTSYDALGRAECSTVRMNLAGTIPASACSQSSGSPDRITKLVYDAAGQVTDRLVGVGTSEAATERHLTYTNNGQLATLTDGNSNVTSYSYDTFDRLYTTTYPDGSFDRNVLYDANGNVTRFRNRAVEVTNFSYDALNRMTLKNAPGTEPDVTYAWDNLGRLTSASQTGTALSFTYDALSRNLTQTGPQGTVTSEWDVAGRRTKVTYPDSGLYVNYDYLVTGEVSKIRENGATSGLGELASYGYNDLGARTSVAYGNGTSRSYSYDPISRLSSMSIAGLTTPAANLVIDNITYNPVSQITGQRRTATYAWSNYSDVTRSHEVNNLNQVTQTSSSGVPNPISFTYDAKGNLTSDGSIYYCYDSENRLTASGATSICDTPTASLGYDPFGRLEDLTASGTTTSFAYDGLNMVGEYSSSTLLRRYVFGPGTDEPIVQYEGGGTTNRRWLYADERGSVVAIADTGGDVIATNKYDEYGIPGSSNSGRFQYTGQAYLPEVGLYYYKARLYSPTLGRFLQTDPIGYQDNSNLYSYVRNDPVNWTDPTGRCPFCVPVVGGIIGIGSEVAYQYSTTGRVDLSWQGLGKLGVAGATGALGGWFGTSVKNASYLGRAWNLSKQGALLGAGNTAANSLLTGERPSFSAYGKGIALGGLSGGLGSFASDGLILAAAGPASLLATRTGSIIIDSAGNAFLVAPGYVSLAADVFGGVVAAGTTVTILVYDENGNLIVITIKVPETKDDEEKKEEKKT